MNGDEEREDLAYCGVGVYGETEPLPPQCEYRAPAVPNAPRARWFQCDDDAVPGSRFCADHGGGR